MISRDKAAWKQLPPGRTQQTCLKMGFQNPPRRRTDLLTPKPSASDRHSWWPLCHKTRQHKQDKNPFFYNSVYDNILTAPSFHSLIKTLWRGMEWQNTHTCRPPLPCALERSCPVEFVWDDLWCSHIAQPDLWRWSSPDCRRSPHYSVEHTHGPR